MPCVWTILKTIAQVGTFLLFLLALAVFFTKIYKREASGVLAQVIYVRPGRCVLTEIPGKHIVTVENHTSPAPAYCSTGIDTKPEYSTQIVELGSPRERNTKTYDSSSSDVKQDTALHPGMRSTKSARDDNNII